MKSFTNTSLATLDILEKAIIGLEFEFYSKVFFSKLIEMLNIHLDPIKVHGFKMYHSKFSPSATEFKLEPDLSGGENMVELITGPLKYHESKLILLKVLAFLQEHAHTTDKCSLHVNISFDPIKSDKVLTSLNPLKLIMKTDETKIYRYFPMREKNIYAKSIKRILPSDGHISGSAEPSVIVNALKLPDTKYFGINFSQIHKNRLEWRYIGGKDYQFKKSQILELFDEFILNTYDSLNTSLSSLEEDKLKRYMADNRQRFKLFENLDDFISNYPNVKLQVDMKSEYEVLKSYYPELRKQIYDLLSNCPSIETTTINWDTQQRQFEVLNADIKAIYELDSFTFIGCEIVEGIYSNCQFIDCTINNVDIIDSKIWDTDVKKSRLYKTDINLNTQLFNCFYNKGFMDGNMEGGVFRAGKVGQNGYISSSTKKLASGDKFFGDAPIGIKKDKKMVMGDDNNEFSSNNSNSIDTNTLDFSTGNVVIN